MTLEEQFWFEVLRDYQIDHILPLPYDRQPIISEALGHTIYSTVVQFDSELASRFLDRTAQFESAFEYVTLAIYYTFLFKLANGYKNFYIGQSIPCPYGASDSM